MDEQISLVALEESSYSGADLRNMGYCQVVGGDLV
jgi:hypothetical protein